MDCVLCIQYTVYSVPLDTILVDEFVQNFAFLGFQHLQHLRVAHMWVAIAGKKQSKLEQNRVG